MARHRGGSGAGRLSRPGQAERDFPGFDPVRVELDDIEKNFRKELEEAEVWYEKVRQDELRWIREGKDVDAEFSRVYYEEPQLSPSTEGEAFSYPWNIEGLLSGIGLAVCGLVVWIWRKRRQRKSATQCQPLSALHTCEQSRNISVKRS